MRFSFALGFFGRYGVLGVGCSCLAVVWFLSRSEYGLAGLFALGGVMCLLSFRGMIAAERQDIREMVAHLSKFESLRFEEACAKAAEESVPIARELARLREFPSPAPEGRHRYFERDEVVFRVEETSDGRARCVLQKLKYA